MLARHRWLLACEATAGGINQNQQSKGLDPQQIQRIVITAPPPVTTNAQHPEPTTPHEARFSLHWPVACMVRFGKVGLQEVMRPEALNDAVLRMVMKTIEVVAAKGWEAGNPSEQGALVRIEAKDGSSHELLLESARGEQPNPLNDRELDAKFLDLVSYASSCMHKANSAQQDDGQSEKSTSIAAGEAMLRTVRGVRELSSVRGLLSGCY